MAAYTKIIDFFGLPACGKSTLMKYVCSHYHGNLKITTKNDLVKEARKHPFGLLTSLSVERFVAGIRLRLVAPCDNKRNEIGVIGWPSHARYYGYAIKHTDYDVVLCDHGDIQDFVSLERGDDLHNNEKFTNACSRYIDKSLATAYVYCKIDAKIALERMQNRGRKTGRLDVIREKELQLQELENEKLRFDFFADMLRKKEKRFFELDMSSPTETIAEVLYSHCNLFN